MKIFPSLLAADPLNLALAIKHVDTYCDGFHIDIMDDHFVNNLSGSVDLIFAVQKITSKPIVVHLMVERAEKWIDRLSLRPSDCFVFHWESAAGEVAKTIIDTAREKKWCVGMAIRPKTPVEEIGELISRLDLLLVMTVEPGHSGQKFIGSSISKLDNLVRFCSMAGRRSVLIMVDGGVGKDNIKDLQKIGVDSVAIGKEIFGSKDPVSAIKSLRLNLSDHSA